MNIDPPDIKKQIEALQFLKKYNWADSIVSTSDIDRIYQDAFNVAIKPQDRCKKLGRKKIRRMFEAMINLVKKRYGPYANLYVSEEAFNFNLKGIFKTSKGRVFQSYNWDTVFYTSHCLERLQERLDLDSVPLNEYSEYFKMRKGTEPTMFDIADMLTVISVQYGIPNRPSESGNKTVYLNVYCGAFIMENYEKNYWIVKTFVSNDMIGRCWFYFKKIGSLPKPDDEQCPGPQLLTFKDCKDKIFSSDWEETKDYLYGNDF